MRAKFIYESLSDYLEPKSEKDIKKELSMSSKKELEEMFILAVINGQIDKVKWLLDAGVNINSRDYSSWTPLMWAVRFKYKDIEELLRKRGAK